MKLVTLVSLFVVHSVSCKAESPAAPSPDLGASATHPATPPATAAPATPSTTPVPAGEGQWSPVVDGLRARFVRVSNAHDAVPSIVIEIENTTDAPREIYHVGRPNLGYVDFRLFEGATEVPEPSWRFPGNEPVGSLRESFLAHQVVRRKIDAAFVDMQGKRALRIGAFWGREMPAHDARIGGTLRGGPVDPKALVVGVDDVAAAKGGPVGKPWVGTLEIPPFAID